MRETLKLGNELRSIPDPIAAQLAAPFRSAPTARRALVHWHDFAQWVLPLSGSLAIDIAGKQGALNRRPAAYVETGQHPVHESPAANRCLILELAAGELQPRPADRWGRVPLLYLGNDSDSWLAETDPGGC